MQEISSINQKIYIFLYFSKVAWLANTSSAEIIVSQRWATSHREPKPWGNQSSLVLDKSRSGVFNDRLVVIFSRPKVLNGSVVNETTTDFFWAAAAITPAPQYDARIVQHNSKGYFRLDLSTAVNADLNVMLGASGYTDYEKMVFAHGEYNNFNVFVLLCVTCNLNGN